MFHNLIKEVSLSFNDIVVIKYYGLGNDVIDHINVSEEDCRICKIFKPQYDTVKSDFVYRYGMMHKYIDEKKIYICLDGEFNIIYRVIKRS